jgi:hypothetical protein
MRECGFGRLVISRSRSGRNCRFRKLKIAFRDNIVDRDDHSLVKRLRGAA